MIKRIIKFQNKNGQDLLGILHIPDNSDDNGIKDVVILSNTGIHYRVAWHRINFNLAEFLCQKGFFVFRFDPHGIGDSQGELIETQNIINHYDTIQSGLFVEDTICAIDLVKKDFPNSKITLAGFCGGALSSILAAGVDNRIDSVIFIAGPVTVTSEVEVKQIHPMYARNLLRDYFKKFFSIASWYRLLTGKSDYSLIKNSISSTMNEKKIRKELIQGDKEGSIGDLFNKKFLDAFSNLMRRNAKILFAMAEVDQATYQFENYFKNTYLQDRFKNSRSCFQIEVIENANHTFTSEQNQEQLFEKLYFWLSTVS